MYILNWYYKLIRWYELRAIDCKFGSNLTEDNVRTVLNALVGRGKHREYILDKYSSTVLYTRWGDECSRGADFNITGLMTYVHGHDLNELEHQRLLEFIIAGVGIGRNIRNYILDNVNILEVSKCYISDAYKYGLLVENPSTGTTRWYYTNINQEYWVKNIENIIGMGEFGKDYIRILSNCI